MDFWDLHRQAQPLLLCNIWDAASARLAEALGFSALGTSSAAMSSLLGHPDGEGMPFSSLLELARCIRASTRLPLSVDIEAGYSRDPAQVAEHVTRLLELGVVAINLEDSLVVNGKRRLRDPDEFAAMIAEVRAHVSQPCFFNIRTDAFLLGMEGALDVCLGRAERYRHAGADGLFAPGVVDPEAIAALAVGASLPLNVMCMPGLPDFSVLAELGVKRISMGDFLFEKTLQQLGASWQAILRQQSFESVYS
ncbi:carboxyvinyl-carboxyphosphonate phosphorylmutase [Xenophilus sp. AP218F]|nr:carboxyvinyl-carboxyphosphonate phosphorylmutase [Xenophilus sp. AP218F]